MLHCWCSMKAHFYEYSVYVGLEFWTNFLSDYHKKFELQNCAMGIFLLIDKKLGLWSPIRAFTKLKFYFFSSPLFVTKTSSYFTLGTGEPFLEGDKVEMKKERENKRTHILYNERDQFYLLYNNNRFKINITINK